MIFGRKSKSEEQELEQKVWDALREVQDPELHKSLVEIGMIKNLKVEEGHVDFDILLTTTACPLKAQIQKDAVEAVKAVEGVKEVKANISGETLAPKVPKKQPIPGIKNIIAVSSGKGGVGKSTLAVNLACALQLRGAKTGILDADIYGPNVPIMMGLKDTAIREKTEEGKMKPPENHGVKVMSMGFLLKEGQAVVWRGPLLDQVIRQFFNDTGWGELDYLIVDLPPGTGDAQLTLIQAVPVTGAVVITTPQDVALADSHKALTMFLNAHIPVLGVVENMSHFVCAHCDEKTYPFGHGGGQKLAGMMNVPFLGEIPMNPKIREEADEGRPIVVADPGSPEAVAMMDISQKLTADICNRGLAELMEETEAVAAVS